MWVLWPVLVGDQGALAHRAASVSLTVKPEGGAVDRQGRFAPSPGPVVSEFGVIGQAPCLTIWCPLRYWSRRTCAGRRRLPRSPDTHRSCIALLNLPKYRAKTQCVGLVEWLTLGPPGGRGDEIEESSVLNVSPEICVRVVGGPAADDRVEPFEAPPGRCPRAGSAAHPRSLFRIRLTACLLGLISSLPPVSADVEPEEVIAVGPATQRASIVVEGQTSGRQPLGQPSFDLERLLPSMAVDDEVIGVSDQHRRALHGALVTILAELGEVRRFQKSRHVARYAGLDITVYLPDAHRAPGHLSRQGPPALRWALYEAAQRARFPGQPPLTRITKQLAERIGGNCARPRRSSAPELLKVSYHLLKALGYEALTPVAETPCHAASPRTTNEPRPAPC